MYYCRPTEEYPALAIGRNGTVVRATGYYSLQRDGPIAAPCEQPKDARTAEGWCRSGQLLFVDADGRQHVVEIKPGRWTAWEAEGECVLEVA
jgi:hypothetical protein